MKKKLVERLAKAATQHIRVNSIPNPTMTESFGEKFDNELAQQYLNPRGVIYESKEQQNVQKQEKIVKKNDSETAPKEYGFKYEGAEPTRNGDWEHKGRCTDFQQIKINSGTNYSMVDSNLFVYYFFCNPQKKYLSIYLSFQVVNFYQNSYLFYTFFQVNTKNIFKPNLYLILIYCQHIWCINILQNTKSYFYDKNNISNYNHHYIYNLSSKLFYLLSLQFDLKKTLWILFLFFLIQMFVNLCIPHYFSIPNNHITMNRLFNF